MPAQVNVPAAVLNSAGLMPSGVIASGVMPIASSAAAGTASTVLPSLVAEQAAGSSLFGFNPTTLLFGLALNHILGKRKKVPEQTPSQMNEAALRQFMQEQMTLPEGGTEGQAETLFDIIQQGEELGNTAVVQQGRDAAEILGLLKAFPAAQDFDFTQPTEADAGGASSSTAATNSALENMIGGAGDAEIVDLTENTTASTIDATLNTAGGGATDDVMETYTYDAGNNVFVSNTSGEAFPAGDVSDVPISDKGVYAVRPVLGQDGTVVAEHVVDESGQAIANIENKNGAAVLAAILEAGNVFGSDTAVAGTGDTTTTTAGDTTTNGNTNNNNGVDDSTTNGDGTGTSTGGTNDTVVDPDPSVTVIKPKVTDRIIGDPFLLPTGELGTGTSTGTGDGDGRDRVAGGDRKGMLSSFVNNTEITESTLIKPLMRQLDNIPVGMFERFMRAAGGKS